MESDEVFLNHTHAEVQYVLEAVESLTEEEFLSDETLKRALARSFEIIGEAVKKLSLEVTLIHPEIEWRQLAGMRDRLIHGNFSVDYGIVFNAVKTSFHNF